MTKKKVTKRKNAPGAGREPLPADKARSHKINVRITEAEDTSLILLRERLGRLSASQVLRRGLIELIARELGPPSGWAPGAETNQQPNLPGSVGRYVQMVAHNAAKDLCGGSSLPSRERCEEVISATVQTTLLSATSMIVTYVRDYVGAHLGDAPSEIRDCLEQLSEDILLQRPWERVAKP
jgi:hypothetical protein